LLSQEQEKERRDAINEIIIHCRRQMVEIDQLKDTETCTMLTGLGCKYGVVKAVQGKIHDFKIWYKLDLEIAREEAEDAASQSLLQLAGKEEIGDSFWDD
jgi:hypothetical protein